MDSIEAKNPLSLLVEFLAGEALERELHVLRGKRLAVLELDVRTQCESEGLEIGREVPFFGEERRDREVLVDLRQPLENIVVRDFADRRGRGAGRIEPRRLEHHADRNAVLGEGEARRGHEGKAEREEKAMGAAHGTLRGRRKAPEHTTASDEIVKQPSPFSHWLERRDLNATQEKSGARPADQCASEPPPPAGRARRSAMNRSNSSRSLARRIASTYSANSRCASSSLRRSSSRRASSAVRHSSKAALPVDEA